MWWPPCTLRSSEVHDLQSISGDWLSTVLPCPVLSCDSSERTWSPNRPNSLDDCSRVHPYLLTVQVQKPLACCKSLLFPHSSSIEDCGFSFVSIFWQSYNASHTFKGLATSHNVGSRSRERVTGVHSCRSRLGLYNLLRCTCYPAVIHEGIHVTKLRPGRLGHYCGHGKLDSRV